MTPIVGSVVSHYERGTAYITSMTQTFTRSPQNTVKRLPQRATYQKNEVFSILDCGFLCHIGFESRGKPVVIPTMYARHGETLYLHGSAASRMMNDLKKGVPACVTVTHVDGIVLARSAFHHSLNYRSAVLFGQAEEVSRIEEKIEALRLFTDTMISGRWQELRLPTAKEIKATTVLSFTFHEASAKIRTGPPKDDPSDLSSEVWAGTIPMGLSFGEPEPDEHVTLNVCPMDLARIARQHSFER